MKKWSIVVALLAIATVAALPAMAGGNGKGGSSIAVREVVLDGARTLDDGLHYGDMVTFDIATTVEMPWVDNACFQNGVKVYGETHGFFEGYRFGQNFTLGPTDRWQGGDADCVARLIILKGTSYRVLASIEYQATA